MNDIGIVTLAALAIMLIITLYSGYIIRGQQRTIDTLSSKVMAKDYHQYFRSQGGTQSGKEAKMEQLSWYDDPHEVKEGEA